MFMFCCLRIKVKFFQGDPSDTQMVLRAPLFSVPPDRPLVNSCILVCWAVIYGHQEGPHIAIVLCRSRRLLYWLASTRYLGTILLLSTRRASVVARTSPDRNVVYGQLASFMRACVLVDIVGEAELPLHYAVKSGFTCAMEGGVSSMLINWNDYLQDAKICLKIATYCGNCHQRDFYINMVTYMPTLHYLRDHRALYRYL